MTIVNDYLSLTAKYKTEYGIRTMLLMQVGSFFECYALVNSEGEYYGSDICNLSDINDLVVSRKNTTHNSLPVVMAGFGVNQLEKYVKRLQENDYTIVIYTQDSNTKNTTRSLSCIYSPGTYFNNETSELNNITTCIWIHYNKSNNCFNEKLTIGMSSIDIYTGYSNTFEYIIDYIKGPGIFDTLENYLHINNPSECIIITNKDIEYISDLVSCKTHNYNYDNEWVKNISKQKYQSEIINTFFDTEIFTEWNVSTQSFCFLTQFLYKHNPNLIKKIQKPSFENTDNTLILANSSLKQLNIISDSRYTGKLSSISSLLNNCITTMGKRAFNYIIKNPITDYQTLSNEYNITEHLLDNKKWILLREPLYSIKDLSKIYRKLILGKLSPRDYSIIYNSLEKVKSLHDIILTDEILADYINNKSSNNSDISACCSDINDYIKDNLNIESCKYFDDMAYDKLSTTNFPINLLNINYSLKLHNNYLIYTNSVSKLESIKKYLNDIIKELEKKSNTEYIKIHETPKSDPVLIGTTRRLNLLKKHFNQERLFENNSELDTKYSSYFNNIEIKSHNGSNSMIYSSELQILYKSINNLKEKYITNLILEFGNFTSNFINIFEKKIEYVIQFIVSCDLLYNKCYIADNYHYCKPCIVNSEESFIDFKELRHPLIEKINENEIYIANDLSFNKQGEDAKIGNESKINGYLLYGTNAVGKTSFIKSIGISIIMAQSGLYVPASLFTFSVYKTLFTRILGTDNLFKGLSTFAVEMTELRNILNLSNRNSLVLGDELCSGTESTSALSIFTAGIQYLSKKNSSYIFATHFHEIINFSEIKNTDSLKLIHMTVVYDKSIDKLVYDRKIKTGPGDNMYGLEVCKSLNLPDDFLELAHTIRNNITSANLIVQKKGCKYNKKKLKGQCEICKEQCGDEIHHLQYQMNANNSNYTKSIKNHKANLINICIKCHDKLHIDNKEFKICKTTTGYEILEQKL